MGYDRGDSFPCDFQNQMEFHLVQKNRKENCHHDHTSFNVKGNENIVFSVYMNYMKYFVRVYAYTLIYKKVARSLHCLINGECATLVDSFLTMHKYICVDILCMCMYVAARVSEHEYSSRKCII